MKNELHVADSRAPGMEDPPDSSEINWELRDVLF